MRDGALPEYTHAAFTVPVEDFKVLSERVERSGTEIWQENSTPGDSLYFLDPDGHKLEIHASNLAPLESPTSGTLQRCFRYSSKYERLIFEVHGKMFPVVGEVLFVDVVVFANGEVTGTTDQV